MAPQLRTVPEFEEIAQAALRMARASEPDLERLARQARRGDAAARRRVVEALLARVVGRVRYHADVGADPMELFEAGAAVLVQTPFAWRPRSEPFVDRVDRGVQDAMQPLLDEATGHQLIRMATLLHGERPRPSAERDSARAPKLDATPTA